MELSRRGARCTAPALSYLDAVVSSLPDRFDGARNPDGFICLAVAENVLTYEALLRPKLAVALGALADGRAGTGGGVTPLYDDMRGHGSVRRAVCALLDEVLLGVAPAAPVPAAVPAPAPALAAAPPPAPALAPAPAPPAPTLAPSAAPMQTPVPAPTYRFSPGNLSLGAGSGALLDLLAWLLCDDGDACIVPAPYYPAFDWDLTIRAKLVLVPCEQGLADGSYQLREEALQAALEAAQARGARPRMLLLTNPQNPLGLCYPRTELEAALAWARNHGLHVVADEVYAASVHSAGAGDAPFVSMCQVALDASRARGENPPRLGDDVHLVYSMSKDFTLSGFRCGFLYSEHAELAHAAGGLLSLGCVAAPAQQLVYELVRDLDWTRAFFRSNNAQLAAACTVVTRALRAAGISFTRPTAGFFVLADLAAALDEASFAAERRLTARMYEEAKLILTPGEACHCAKPGLFRICFAAVRPDALDAALERLSRFYTRAAQTRSASAREQYN
jgi:1-aminocyclopropane-1-carboxylate synthase